MFISKFIYLFLLFVFIKCINSIFFIKKYLTPNQWVLIDKILLNPNTTDYMKKKIHIIIHKYYDQWAFTQAYRFKLLHKYKCQHISTIELYNYASYGLYKSIKKYNSNYKNYFVNYAKIYVNSELLKGLTDLHPTSRIPKSERKKGYSKDKKQFNQIQLVGENDWIYDIKLKENVPKDSLLLDDEYFSLWLLINQLSGFQKRIMFLKYNYYFDKIRSNKEVANLMCCSEELVRTNLISISTLLHINSIKNNNSKI
jgi:hypothetical protein